MEISYSDAWHLWWQGYQVQDSILWGKSILFWGRFGKVIQFLAALTILAEIVGPVRIRQFGSRLKGILSLSDVLRFCKAPYLWLSHLATEGPDSSAPEELDRIERFVFKAYQVLYMLVTMGVGWFCLIFAYAQWDGWWLFIPAIIVTVLIVVMIFLLINTILVTPLFLVLFLLDFLILEPVAWLVDRERIDIWIKSCSVLLLIIGFHFDLLAS